MCPPSRQEQLDPLLTQQLLPPKQTEHLVAEQILGRPLVHIRHRDPLPGGGPASSREENSEEAQRRIKDLLAK